jgi:excisionase family DNA binding protein
VTPHSYGVLSETEWLSASQAGALLGVHARTVGRWIRAGRLRGRFTEGGHVRVRREDVERLAVDQETRAVQLPTGSLQPFKEARISPAS